MRHLHIKNFAVVEEVDIEFEQGMIIFTGETGAGKSIMVGAVGLILGDRVDSNVIRTGCKRAEVTATFEVDPRSEIRALLNEQEIEYNKELIIRRTISTNSHSRAYVNGTHVPIKLLRCLGEYMIDVHGQHAHHALLRETVQRELLDAFGEYPQVLQDINDSWEEWHKTELAWQALEAINDENYYAKTALLKYQIQELEALDIETLEFAQIEQEHSRLANANQLLEVCQKVQQQLSNDEHSVHSQINHILNSLQGMQQFDPSLSIISTLLNTANIEIAEANDELRHYLDKLEIDPERLKHAEDQLNVFHEMARKHNTQPETLGEQLQILRDELSALEGNKVSFEALQTSRQSALEAYRVIADQLTQCRQQTAKKLSADVSNRFSKLGMHNGKLSLNIRQFDHNKPMKNGIDKVEFLVSLNPGQPLQPLNKVASGGELSRISLAIQISAKKSAVPTLIFDEIDSGIGGGTAEIVGELLHDLADQRQIFCITHLPQVAVQGEHHLKISKITSANNTVVHICRLNNAQRINEIARMLGGVEITEQTLAHAKEMLQK